MSMKMCIWLVAASYCIVLASPVLAQQIDKGEITGHVSDPAGAVIGKASVFVRKSSPAEETVRLVTHTDQGGNFIVELPEAGYDILVAAPGFQSALQSVPAIRAKKRKTAWKLQAIPCNFPGVNCDTFR